MKVYWDYRDVDGVGPCKVYFLNGIPFTFDEDEVPPVHDKEYLVKQSLTNEDIFRGSSYLMEEGFHPLLDEVELDECSELPAE